MKKPKRWKFYFEELTESTEEEGTGKHEKTEKEEDNVISITEKK